MGIESRGHTTSYRHAGRTSSDVIMAVNGLKRRPTVYFQVWTANSAIMMTVVWLHLAVSVQRLTIIFSFSKYRKVFTQTVTGVLLLGAWLLGLIVIYTPLRVLGVTTERAGR